MSGTAARTLCRCTLPPLGAVFLKPAGEAAVAEAEASDEATSKLEAPAQSRSLAAQWNRYVCIHGHFYQPPRENPWLEAIEAQDSAYPYHDWNERITAECYAPNATPGSSTATDGIVAIVNNYASISFNFGPTLLSLARGEGAGRLPRRSSRRTRRAATASPGTARRSRRPTTT